MANSANKKNTRRGGLYFLPSADKPLLTVTKIIGIIDKPSLIYWACGIVYDEIIKDPSIERNLAISAPRRESGLAKERGLTVHSAVEAFKNGATIDTSGTPKHLKGYLDAFQQWVVDFQPFLIEQERTVVNLKEGYAGTLDIRCRLHGTEDLWIIDVKTSKAIYDATGLQLSAYNLALLESGEKNHRLGVLLLGEDGTYKFEEKLYEPDAFLAAKKLYIWKNKKSLIKYGYLIE